MSDSAFHTAASRLFTGLRDLHTAYVMPAPYSCVMVAFPFRFELILNGDRWTPHVSGFMSDNITSLNPQARELISVGDELVSIDDRSFEEYIAEEIDVLGGANSFGLVSSILAYAQTSSAVLP